MTNYIIPFSPKEKEIAAALVKKLAISLLGRKLEEGDWTDVYCAVKGVKSPGWSNLPFRDYIHDGIGVEFKLLQRSNPMGDMGRALMHPSATRTISFDEAEPAERAKAKVLTQWGAQIAEFEERIRRSSARKTVDARWGVLLWSPDHTQFLYFEERLIKPNPNDYTARWHDGQHRGKTTRNLHIFDKRTGEKKFSCTLPRNGAKLQPYFVVPTEAQGAAVFQLTKANLVALYVNQSLRDRLNADFPGLSDNEIIEELLAGYHRSERT